MLTMLRRLCEGTTEGTNRITEGVSEEVVYYGCSTSKNCKHF